MKIPHVVLPLYMITAYIMNFMMMGLAITALPEIPINCQTVESKQNLASFGQLLRCNV